MNSSGIMAAPVASSTRKRTPCDRDNRLQDFIDFPEKIRILAGDDDEGGKIWQIEFPLRASSEQKKAARGMPDLLDWKMHDDEYVF